MGDVKGYKVFNKDWTCMGFQYTCPGIFEEDVKPMVYASGFHFCERASDCLKYYSFNPENKVAEVIALGEVDSDGTKSCTNKIQIVREIPWDEVLRIVNTGKIALASGTPGTGTPGTGTPGTGTPGAGTPGTGTPGTGTPGAGTPGTGTPGTGTPGTGTPGTGTPGTGTPGTGTPGAGTPGTGTPGTGTPGTGTNLLSILDVL